MTHTREDVEIMILERQLNLSKAKAQTHREHLGVPALTRLDDGSCEATKQFLNRTTNLTA